MSRPPRKALELEQLGGREQVQGNHLLAVDFYLEARRRYRDGGNLDAAQRCARAAAAALDRDADALNDEADRERRRRRTQ